MWSRNLPPRQPRPHSRRPRKAAGLISPGAPLQAPPYVKKVYSKRKETIERVFADAKEKHGMRYTKLRGLSKIEMEVSLIFSCMNLKKLANWMWKDTSNNLRLTPIFSILSLKIFIKKKIAILYKLKMAILSTI